MLVGPSADNAFAVIVEPEGMEYDFLHTSAYC